MIFILNQYKNVCRYFYFILYNILKFKFKLIILYSFNNTYTMYKYLFYHTYTLYILIQTYSSTVPRYISSLILCFKFWVKWRIQWFYNDIYSFISGDTFWYTQFSSKMSSSNSTVRKLHVDGTERVHFPESWKTTKKLNKNGNFTIFRDFLFTGAFF